MAIDSKKYEALHDKTGSDLAKIKKHFDDGDHNRLLDFPGESALVYQIQKIQEELDYLRGLISDNKDKTTFPGFGTSNSTALRGDTTTISTSQANAITANTAKVSFPTCSTNVDSSTASITGFAHVYDAKAKSNSLQINVTVTNSKGLSSKYSTTLILK